MKIGRRLAIKILNASKFALGVMGDDVLATRRPSTCPSTVRCWPRSPKLVDARDRVVRRLRLRARARAHRAVLLGLLRRLPRAGEARAPTVRLGDAGARSARTALTVALSTLLRLFAPHLPFVTEEVWSWWQRRFGAPRRVADGRRARSRRRRHARVHRRGRGARRDPQGEERRAALDAHRGRARPWCTSPARAVARARARARRRARGRSGRRATSTSSRETSSGSRSSSPHPTRPRASRWSPARHGRGSTRTPTCRRARRGAGGAHPAPDGARPPSPAWSALIELLGSPQLQYPAMHITGTNGKTSAARMTTALLVAAGLSVGAYTSPYLAAAQRAHVVERRADLRRGARPDPASGWPTVEPAPGRPTELLRDHHRGRASSGSPTSPSTSR